MPSLVWGRDPQEAFEEPYEYGAQKQFFREARRLLHHLYEALNAEIHTHTIQERSSGKAVWLLAMDSLDSLRSAVDCIERKEHRLTGRLFRDVTETMDLAAYFSSATGNAMADLEKWFNDEIVPHRRYRDYVKKTKGEQEQKKLATLYSQLSRFTHRSYEVLLHGYLRAAQGRLAHDGRGALGHEDGNETSLLVLPHTISMYCAMLANVIVEFTAELPEIDLVTAQDVRRAFELSLEEQTVPRRFNPRRWLLRTKDEIYQREEKEL